MEEMKRPHVVCIPFPAQGHINPMMQLAKLLHSRGFSITFVNTDFSHKLLLKSRGLDSLEDLDGFRFEVISDGLSPSFGRAEEDGKGFCKSVKENCVAPFCDLLKKLHHPLDGHRVTCVISDSFMTFTLKVAEELGIPEVIFCPTAACGFMAFAQYHELMRRGLAPLKGSIILETSVVATAFLEWNRQDQNLLSWIRATLSEHVLSQVVGLHTSHAVWNAIEQRFASLSRAHTIELKRQLQNLQKGNLSITDYLLKHKTIVDELCAVGHFVDESDQVTHILEGLPEEYDPVFMNVAAANQSDHVFVAYVHGLLLNMKMRLAHHRSSSASPSDQTTTALFTPKTGQANNSNRGGGCQGRGHGLGGGRGSPHFYSPQGSHKNNNATGQNSTRGPARIPCQICNWTGHSALD